MRLLFCIKTLSAAKGGAERVLTDVVNGLAARGHEVHVLTFDAPRAQPFYTLSSDVIPHFIGLGDVAGKTSPQELWSRFAGIRKVLQTLKPDIAIGFMHSMFVPLSLAAIGTRVPVIASEHIVPAHYSEKKVEFALLILAGLLSKKMTVLSEAVKSAYPPILRSRMICIPNPVFMPETPFRQEENSGRKIILNVGRLDPQKDQKTLIEAFAQLTEEFPDWDVHIIGAGPLEDALDELIVEKKLFKRIILKGTVSQISDAYSVARIFAMPSLYESFGLATAEAMAHELPVIGFSDCMGTNELVKDGISGLLVRGPDRIAAFRDGLKELMLNPEKCRAMGQAGRQSVQKFAAPVILDLWEKLLLSCFNKIT